MKIPNEVQEAWNTVAKFLNEQEDLVFFVDTRSADGDFDKRYTLKSSGRKINIVADTKWNPKRKGIGASES